MVGGAADQGQGQGRPVKVEGQQAPRMEEGGVGRLLLGDPRDPGVPGGPRWTRGEVGLSTEGIDAKYIRVIIVNERVISMTGCLSLNIIFNTKDYHNNFLALSVQKVEENLTRPNWSWQKSST